MSGEDKAESSELRAEGPALNKRGLPIDVNEWTEDDWRDLHNALERVVRKIGRRHRAKLSQVEPPTSTNPKT